MLYELLKKQAIEFGDKPAVVGEARTLSFRGLYAEATALANYLSRHDLPVGATVLIGIAPSPEFYVAFHASAALGLVIMPVLPSVKLPAVMMDTKPLVAFGNSAFVREAQHQCPSIKIAIVSDKHLGIEYPKSDQGLQRPHVYRDDKIIAVSSSGSTGEPTVFFRSAELLVRRAEFRADSLGITSRDILLSARPFNSGSSINSHVVMPLVSGSTIAVQKKFQRFQAAEIIDREKVTILYSVPFIFELLSTIPMDYPVTLASLRLCISGSAPLAPSVSKAFFDRYGLEIRQRYGGSHIHPAFTFNAKGVSGAVGQTCGPFPIAILDDDAKPLAAESVGEIAFDFEQIAPEWQIHLKLNPNLHGRYIHTGDLGRADKDGNVFVVGRKSPFIKVRGNRVEPAEVEAVVRAHPAVREAFVFTLAPGQPDEAVGLALTTQLPVREREILEFCAARLEGYKCPRRIAILEEFPRNAHGKIDRNRLSQELAAG